MLKIVKTSLVVTCISLLNMGIAQANIGETFEHSCTIVKAVGKAELGKKLKQAKPDFKSKIKDYYTNAPCGNGSQFSRSQTLVSASLYLGN